MKKYIYPILAATALVAAGCSSDNVVENQVPDGQKDMINLSVGLGENLSGQTSRAIADPTYTGFTAKTRILMRLQSDDTEAATGNHRYTKTLAHAQIKETGKDYSKVNQTDFAAAYIRYWDDCFGRSAHLSAFAVAIPNYDDSGLLPETALKGSSTAWETTANDNKITWTVDNSNTTTMIQDATTLAKQDLAYSNNIQKGSTVGGRYVWDFTSSAYIPNIDQTLSGSNVFTADRMRFKLQNSSDNTSPGKFDKGHLVFNHALSRLTLTIKAGTGFDVATKFILDVTGNNGVQALGMNVTGNLDVQAGTWEINATKGTITTQPTITRVAADAATSTPASASYTTSMQMLPEYTFTDGSNTNVLKFKIDENEYYITQDLIFDALKENAGTNGLDASASSYSMLQGKNYKLTITVNKTKIDAVTATIADWQDITAAEKNLYNSYVTLNLKSPTGTACDNFDLYRMAVDAGAIYTSQTPNTADSYVNKDWMGNYSEHLTPTKNATTGKWETTWVYENNRTFYHFRTVKTGTTVKETSTLTDDYFEISSGAVSAVDPHWGAPMEGTVTDYTYSPQSVASATGYGANISKAIGSTTSDVNIQEFHMLSEINVIVKTIDSNAKVKLYDDKGTSSTTDDIPTVVTLYQFKENGQVKMGNGLVTATGDATKSQELTKPAPFFKDATPAQTIETNAFTWRVVPQVLSRGSNKTDKVAIKIQTPDENLYYCIEDLSAICPTGSSTPIGEWLPNHRYVYTFIISKKGIEVITCSVANWIDVTAADKNLNLED